MTRVGRAQAAYDRAPKGLRLRRWFQLNAAVLADLERVAPKAARRNRRARAEGRR